MDLSVVIVSYNTRELLRQCLASLVASLESMAHRLEYDVFVVDNASRDGSPEMVREAFPQVKLLALDENLGFSRANNIAVEQSQGQRLLFLNPDTVVLGNAIGELFGFLEGHPSVGAVAGSLLYPDGSFQHGAFRFPNLWMTFLDLFPLHHRLSNSSINGRYPREAYYDDFEIDHPLGACFMVRRDVVEEVGAFCPDFFLYCEEIDWCLRMKEAGWKVYCHPAAKVVHYGGQSTRQVRDSMFVELYRSRLLLFRRHYSPLFQAINRAVTGVGILWELFCALRSLGRGEATREQYLSRAKACQQILRMVALDHG